MDCLGTAWGHSFLFQFPALHGTLRREQGGSHSLCATSLHRNRTTRGAKGYLSHSATRACIHTSGSGQSRLLKSSLPVRACLPLRNNAFQHPLARPRCHGWQIWSALLCCSGPCLHLHSRRHASRYSAESTVPILASNVGVWLAWSDAAGTSHQSSVVSCLACRDRTCALNVPFRGAAFMVRWMQPGVHA